MRILRIVVFFALVLLSACGSGPWPAEKQDEFLDGCAEEGGSSSYCRCYLDQVMERFPNPADAEKIDFETAVELASKCE